MIAEKAADAIRGRKLAPFEPPTRIATGGSTGYNRQQKQHYPGAAKMHASSSSMHYANRHFPPQTAQYQSSYLSRQHQKQLQYPPPIGQQTNAYSHAPYLSRSLAKELAAAASSLPISNITTLPDISTSSLTHNHDFSEYLALAAAADAGGNGDTEEVSEHSATPGSSDEFQRDSNQDFLLKRYGFSKMSENLIKRISPIR